MLKKLIILLLFLSAHLFAAETVYAWGYGDLLVETLKAVKYMFSIGEFRDFWKIAVLISMISAVLMMLTPNPDFLKLPKIFIFTMGIYALFVTAKIDVYVDDKADNTNSGVVTQVPWAVGYPLALFSALEYRIGATYETATSIPNGMKYSDSGFMTPISIFNQATSHKIVTPFLYQNLDNYIMECVMPDIENGYKDYRTLISSDNVWSYLGNTSPAIFMLYNDQNNNTSLKTCTEVYSSLNSLLNAYVGTSGEGMEYLGKSLGMLSSSAVSSKLGIANQYLSNSSKNASQLLLQTTAINMFSETFRSYAAMNGANVESAAFHSASAGQAAAAQMVVSGMLGSKYIPIMKGVLTAIIVGLTPILALMMATPMAFRLIMGYITILAWLCSWHFGEAILNHIMLTKTQSALNSYGDLIFQNKGLIQSTMTDYINMAASMYWTVPSLAAVIVTGFSFAAFSALNTAVNGKLDRNSSVVAQDMARGNMNFGNVGHNTYSANKLDALASGTFGQNTRVDYSNTYTSGSSSNVINGLSTTQGTQAFGGGLGGSWVNSALSQDLGKQYDFKEAVQSTTNIGGGRHQATSAGTIQATGEDGRTITANADSGNIYTKGSDGQLQLHSGKVNLMDNGKSIEAEYKDGKEFKRTVTDEQGNKTEATTMDNGVDKSFKWTSGQDSGSVVTGVYNARANTANITDGKINGSDLAKTDSGITTYSMNDVRSAQSSKQRSLDDSKTNTTEEREEDSKTQKDSSTDSSEKSKSANVSAGAKFLGNGGQVEAAAKDGHTEMTVDEKSNTVTFSGGKTEAKTYKLSNSEMDSLNSSLGKQTSNSSGMNASRDMNASRVEEIANKGLANGQSLDEIFKNIVQNKDAYHSGSIASTGNQAPENVNNALKEDKPSRNFLNGEVSNITGNKEDISLKHSGDNNNTNKSIDNVTTTYGPQGKKNSDGEKIGNGEVTGRDLMYELEKQGIATYNRAGESRINDWNSIEKLSKEEVGKLKNFGDFGETTQNRLNKIYESKTNNVQPTKTSNVEVPNQQTNNVQPTSKGDGHFKAEGSLENLEKVTEVMKPKGNSQKQVVPEVNDKK